MNKSSKVKLLIYFIAFILPIFGMMNCSGFHEGNMTVETCFLDVPLLRSYANFYLGFLTISSFMLFIPIFIYIGITIVIAMVVARYI